MLGLVVDEHESCWNHVGQDCAPDIPQGVLVEKPPWGVGSSEEDGLTQSSAHGSMVAVPSDCSHGDLHDHR